MRRKSNSTRVLANRIIKTAGRCVSLQQQNGESILLFGKRVAFAHGIDRKSCRLADKVEIADLIQRARQKTHPELHDKPLKPKSPERARISCDRTEMQLKEFYLSPQWVRLSYDVKRERGRRCECCGSTPEHGVRIITDHIKPIRKHWHLRLERTNLQVLCDDCNLGKGSRDETDFRRSEDEIPEGVCPLLIAQLTPPDGVFQ